MYCSVNWQSASYAMPHRVPNIQLHHDWCKLVMLFSTKVSALPDDFTCMASGVITLAQNFSAWCRGAADVCTLLVCMLTGYPDQLPVCKARQEPPSQHAHESCQHVSTWRANWQKRALLCMLTGCSGQLHVQCKRSHHHSMHMKAANISLYKRTDKACIALHADWLFRTATCAMQKEPPSQHAHESCACFDVASPWHCTGS